MPIIGSSTSNVLQPMLPVVDELFDLLAFVLSADRFVEFIV